MSEKFFSLAILDSIKYSLSKTLPALIGFIGVVIYTKLFSPEEYGNYALVQSFILFLTIFPSGLLGNSALRFFIPYKDRNDLKSYYSVILILYIFYALCVFLIFLCIRYIFRGHLSKGLFNLYILACVEVLFYGAFSVSLAIFVADFRSRLYLLYSILLGTLKVLVVVFLAVALRQGIYSVMLGSILSIAFLLPFIIKGLPGPVLLSFDKRSLLGSLEFLSYGAPLALLSLANWGVQYANRYIISLFGSAEAIAQFTVAFNFSQLAILTALSGILLQASPTVIELFERKGKPEAASFITLMAHWSIVVGLPLGVGFSLLGREILEVLSRKEYVAGAHLILPFSLSALFAHLAFIYNKAFELTRKTAFSATYFILGGVICVLGSLVSVPYLGILGASISNLLAFILIFLLVFLRGKKILHYVFPFRACVWGGTFAIVVILASITAKALFFVPILRILSTVIIFSVISLPILYSFWRKIFVVDLFNLEP